MCHCTEYNLLAL